MNRPLILAVDDDEDSLLLLKQALEIFSLTLVTTTTGRSGLLMAALFQPQLILLDMRLPDISGFEVVRQLKRQPGTRSIPVLAISALVHTEYLQEMLLAGCDSFLGKPYFLNDLEVAIHQLLPQLCPECA